MEMIGGASRVPWVKERLPLVLTETLETESVYITGTIHTKTSVHIMYECIYITLKYFKATICFAHRS